MHRVADSLVTSTSFASIRICSPAQHIKLLFHVFWFSDSLLHSIHADDQGLSGRCRVTNAHSDLMMPLTARSPRRAGSGKSGNYNSWPIVPFLGRTLKWNSNIFLMPLMASWINSPAHIFTWNDRWMRFYAEILKAIMVQHLSIVTRTKQWQSSLAKSERASIDLLADTPNQNITAATKHKTAEEWPRNDVPLLILCWMESHFCAWCFSHHLSTGDRARLATAQFESNCDHVNSSAGQQRLCRMPWSLPLIIENSKSFTFKQQ